MAEQRIVKMLAKAVAGNGFMRWTLAIVAFIALLVGAGGGAVISLLLFQFFETWKLWMHALPGAGFAVFIALLTLWASMNSTRRFLYFK